MKRATVAGLTLLAGAVSFTTPAAAQMVLEEIIVTAQKRAQSMQDVPLAVTAIDETMMADQNIFDITDLNRAVPSLSVVKGYNRAIQTQLTIRGVGTNGTQAAFEGSVGTYIDGIYRSRPGMALSTMLDIGRVEVLRGPQGTLFGKNTTAGAIVMSSIAPQEELAYGGELTLGDYDRQRFMGYISGGLGDSVQARFALLSDKREGFTEPYAGGDAYGELDIESYKLNLLWQVTDAFEVGLVADYSTSEENCCFGDSLNYNREGGLTQGPLADYYLELFQVTEKKEYLSFARRLSSNLLDRAEPVAGGFKCVTDRFFIQVHPLASSRGAVNATARMPSTGEKFSPCRRAHRTPGDCISEVEALLGQCI